MNVKRAFEGLTLIVIGCILLGNTLGGLPWAVWVSILSLWPLALVAAGIDIIGSSTRQTWLRVIASLLTLSALLYGAFVMTPGTWGFPGVFGSGVVRTDSFSQSEPHTSRVRTGDADIDAAATQLKLAAGDRLASLDGDALAGVVPSLDVTESDGVASVRIGLSGRSTVFTGAGSPGRTDVTLDRRVTWNTVTLNAGATNMDLDLRELRVEALEANVGASSATVAFSGDTACDAAFHGGACSLLLRVPKDSDVTLVVQGFPIATSVPAGFRRTDGVLGSGTWTRAGDGPRLHIVVTAGAASVEVVDDEGAAR